MKIKWKVEWPPTGRYRSFQARGWPSAEDQDGEPLAAIYHRESYTAQLAKDAGPESITVNIADHSIHPWKWRTLTKRFDNVSQAKQMVKLFFESRPELWPENNKLKGDKR